MSKIYRIKATPGKDQNLTVNISQDFEEIELLSLKIRQEDVYPIGCANYGVIAGGFLLMVDMVYLKLRYLSLFH